MDLMNDATYGPVISAICTSGSIALINPKITQK